MNPVPQKSSVPTPDPIILEEDFSALFDEQAALLEKNKSRANLVIFAFFGLIAASGLIWYAASAGNRRIVSDLVMDFKSSEEDFKMITGTSGMAGQYDQALDKIGTRSLDIDEASVSLGVDPFKVKEDGMEPEMKEMMGGEGVTVGDRNRMLENSVIGKMAKGSAPKTPKPSTAKGQVPAPAAAATARKASVSPSASSATSAQTPVRPLAKPQPSRVATPQPKVVPVADDAPLVIP